MSITLTGGWTPDDLIMVVSASAIFSASSVGDVIILGYYEDVPLRVTIEQYVTAYTAVGRPNSTVAPAYQTTQTSYAFAHDTFTGLDHLEGLTVNALADGFEQGPFTVTDGTITLNPPAAVVHVGLPYDCDMETLDVNIVGGESVAGRAKLIKEVVVQVVASRDISVGTTFDYMREYSPLPVGMGRLPELTTGTIRVQVSSEWGMNGRVCIRHSSPLPLTILSVIPDVLFGGN
jgi:hypothetical protein